MVILQQSQRSPAIIHIMLALLGWFFAVITLIFFFGIVTLARSTYDWKLWPAIRRAKQEIKKTARRRIRNAEVLSKQGATKINPGHLSFCVKTDTDKERDVLSRDPEIYRDFRAALATAGYPTDTDPVVRFGIQSQETVDRDYGGNWDEAAEKP